MIIAHHLIGTAYGWWLPNDPRGSNSRCIRNDVIAQLGELHYRQRRIQSASPVIRAFYEVAARVLKYPLLTFDEPARLRIGSAFGEVVRRHGYTCYACAIMPDHYHILIRKHKHGAEEMLENLRQASREKLRASDPRWAAHPVWSDAPGWKVFVDHPDQLRATIRYIERNPLPLSLPVQQWDFVKLYDGWPLHPGHNPNSPYVQSFTARRAPNRKR